MGTIHSNICFLAPAQSRSGLNTFTDRHIQIHIKQITRSEILRQYRKITLRVIFISYQSNCQHKKSEHRQSIGIHLYYCANFWRESDSDLSNTQIPDKKIKKKISSNLSNQQEARFLWRILPTYNNPGQYLIFRTNRQLLRGSILLANSVIETNCSFLSEIKLEVDLLIFLKINVCHG